MPRPNGNVWPPRNNGPYSARFVSAASPKRYCQRLSPQNARRCRTTSAGDPVACMGDQSRSDAIQPPTPAGEPTAQTESNLEYPSSVLMPWQFASRRHSAVASSMRNFCAQNSNHPHYPNHLVLYFIYRARLEQNHPKLTGRYPVWHSVERWCMNKKTRGAQRGP